MIEKFGFPVVTSPESLAEVLESLGLKLWPVTAPPAKLQEYMQEPLSEDQRTELRFAPEILAKRYNTPDGKAYTAFTAQWKDWATVVVTNLSDAGLGRLIPFVAEYKHGRDKIVLVPPSGVATKADLTELDPLKAAGQRELLEETGIRLRAIWKVSNPLSSSSRQTNQACTVYGAMAEDDALWGKPNLDKTEFLKPFLIQESAFWGLTAPGNLPEPYEFELTTISAIALALR